MDGGRMHNNKSPNQGGDNTGDKTPINHDSLNSGGADVLRLASTDEKGKGRDLTDKKQQEFQEKREKVETLEAELSKKCNLIGRKIPKLRYGLFQAFGIVEVSKAARQQAADKKLLQHGAATMQPLDVENLQKRIRDSTEAQKKAPEKVKEWKGKLDEIEKEHKPLLEGFKEPSVVTDEMSLAQRHAALGEKEMKLQTVREDLARLDQRIKSLEEDVEKSFLEFWNTPAPKYS